MVSFIGGENHRPNVSHRQTSSHMLYRVHLAVRGIQIPNLVVIGTDCIGSGYLTTILQVLHCMIVVNLRLPIDIYVVLNKSFQ